MYNQTQTFYLQMVGLRPVFHFISVVHTYTNIGVMCINSIAKHITNIIKCKLLKHFLKT